MENQGSPMESKPTILVVDDTAENIKILMGILKEKYKVKAVLSGEEAIATIQKNLPDLVLLDIMMPGIDGYETCKRLKDTPETQDLPIIFLTAKTEAEDVLKGFQFGAVDYVTKPFNSAELLSRVNTHLQLRHSQQKLEVLTSKLSKYLSPQVYDSIFKGEKDVKIESTRKKLSIFFSDIVGFTSTSEEMKHRELTVWLNNYLNEMANITFSHGGTLDKFIGDAVMVFFGDPHSLGEQQDSIQCVKMAREMSLKAKELGVNIRVGINSGECTVGNFGSENRMEYTIIGRAVNLAARLEENCESGKILIADSTYQFVMDEIECHPKGTIRVKGIDRDIMTYEINP